ncbi:type I secretion system permease/ATPase [Rhodoferax mekongensis]|uniref:Type I secretion system permease/ATPase n=1 Tax=Rhodoferax mekongensis TaxID=3068341 RepID=A0ABZ0AZ42_9BURK|nr:type I secretion system permease/ATPase [Rhodoferax sp. TBRC 17307]WNO04898.1 type I secretion system permease/ATPase [Rhodoferax sp. TBRC 17307]
MVSPNPSSPDELKHALRQLRSAFVTVAVFSGFLNLMMLAPSLYMMQVYDRVLGSRNETTLFVLTLLVLGAYLFMAALETIRSWILVRVSARLDHLLGLRVLSATFERMLRQPGNSSTQPLHDLTTLRQSLTGPGLIAVFDAPWAPLYLLIIASFSSEVAVFTMAGALVLVAITWLNEKLAKAALGEAQKYSMQSQRELSSHLQNVEVIEAMGMLGQIQRRWQKLHTQEIGLQARASDRAAVMGNLTKFVRISMQSLSLGLAALLVLEGKMTGGMMIAVSLLTSRALAPAEGLVGNWASLVATGSAYQRLKELLLLFPARPPAMPLPAPSGQVAFENVATAAPGGRAAIIKQISFQLQAGDSVAVIGASGAGKSTLARLLVGIWPALSGTVRLDGADLVRWNKQELGPYIGYLPQDIELFDGTVAENIARFGEIDPQLVVVAAQRVGFHEQILRLPQGYDTPVGAGGAALSGGQRQRIALARALYGNPVLVVLDEPNSNLDDMGEKALTDAIKDLSSRGRTSVIITHRPSALGAANKLMVLRDGVIAAFGPREEVLAALNGRAMEAPAPVPAAANSAGPPRGAVPPVLVNKQAPSAPAPALEPVRAEPPARKAAPEPDPASGMPPFNLKFSD